MRLRSLAVFSLCRCLALPLCLLGVLVPSALAQHRHPLPAGLLKIYTDFNRRSLPPNPAATRPLIQQKRQGRMDAVDPAFQSLLVAYESLREEDFDTAIAYFNKAIGVSPQRTDIRKDLGYTYYKVGSNDLALLQFKQVTVLDPADFHSALEVAFLEYESTDPRQKATARRIFDQIRKVGDPDSKATAEQAFQNIDGALAAQISQYQAAVQLDPGNFHINLNLAWAADARDDFDLAIQNYIAAEPLQYGTIYVSLGEVLTAAGRTSEAQNALLKATQMPDPFAAEQAKDMLAQLSGN